MTLHVIHLDAPAAGAPLNNNNTLTPSAMLQLAMESRGRISVLILSKTLTEIPANQSIKINS